jgi:hypothetical protein
MRELHFWPASNTLFGTFVVRYFNQSSHFFWRKMRAKPPPNLGSFSLLATSHPRAGELSMKVRYSVVFRVRLRASLTPCRDYTTKGMPMPKRPLNAMGRGDCNLLQSNCIVESYQAL